MGNRNNGGKEGPKNDSAPPSSRKPKFDALLLESPVMEVSDRLSGLVRALGDKKTADAAHKELIAIGRPAAPALMKGLETGGMNDWEMLENAAATLDLIGISDEQFECVLRMLSGSPEHIYGALQLLQTLADIRALDALIGMDNYDAGNYGATVLDAIASIVRENKQDTRVLKAMPLMIEALGDDDFLSREAAVRTIAVIAENHRHPDLEKAESALIELLDREDEALTCVIQTLGIFGSISAVPAIMRVFTGENAYLRSLKDESEFNITLGEAMKKRIQRIREGAALGVVEIANANPGNPALLMAVPALVDEILKAGDDRMKDLVKIALIAIGAYPLQGRAVSEDEDKKFNGIVNTLKNGKKEERANAALALQIRRDAKALPALIDALDDRAMAVRKGAVLALGTTAKANSGDAEVLRQAVTAVAGMLTCENTRAGSIDALIHVGEPAVPVLIEALRLRKRSEWKKIAKALGNPAQVDALRKRDTQMREEIVGVLGYIKAPLPLVDALDDKDRAVRRKIVRALAYIALYKLHDSEDRDIVINALIKAKADSDERVRQTAQAGLRMARIDPDLAADMAKEDDGQKPTHH